MRRALAIAAGVALAAVAHAGPADLQLQALPPRPATLHMRSAPQVAQAAPAAPAPPPATAAGDAVQVTATRRGGEAAPRDLSRAITFRFDLGFALDGAGLSKKPTLTGGTLGSANYEEARPIGLGDLFLGSRGLGLPSLGTYLAAHARFAATSDLQQPLSSAYDAEDPILIRSAWAESDGLFRQRWLRPLRARAGRQFLYGPAIVHMDGTTVAYETRAFEAHLYAGSRVRDWAPSRPSADVGGQLSGGDVRLDLAHWQNIPVVLSASSLRYEGHNHNELSLAYANKKKDLVVRAAARRRDGQWVRESGSARIQVSDVTQITVDVSHRSSDDWRYDYEWIDADDTSVLRFLYLGLVTPRLMGSVRAGTVLLDNVDVLVRAATSSDLSRRDAHRDAFSPSWYEAGGAVELRLRRAVGIGASVLGRNYRRPEVAVITDVEETQPDAMRGQPLPDDPTALGERGYAEGGLTVRYTGGARRFSAIAELYGRQTRSVALYENDNRNQPPGEPKLDDLDRRGGGRFTLEAWPLPQVRLLAEYDLTTALELSPEIRSLKSLRLMAEGTF